MRFFFKHGDTKYPFIIKLANDLTGCTVRLIISNFNKSETLFDEVVSITDALNGIVEYQIGQSNIEPGKYRGELEINYPDHKIEFFPKMDQMLIEILPNLRDNVGNGDSPTLPNGVVDGGSF